MFRHSLRQGRAPRLVVPAVSSLILVLCLCSCQTTDPTEVTGSIGGKSHASDPRRDVETCRDRYRANPKDPDAALQYAKALRAAGERSQAVAVLEQATIANPSNKALLAIPRLKAMTGGVKNSLTHNRRTRPATISAPPNDSSQRG